MLSKLQKVSKLRFGSLRHIINLHVLVMGGRCFFLVSTFDKCFELSIYSNERRFINCVPVLTFLMHKTLIFVLLIARSPYCRFRFG